MPFPVPCSLFPVLFPVPCSLFPVLYLAWYGHPVIPPPPDRLRGVLFDLDGVLIDSARAWYNVIRRGVERLGRAAPSYEEFQRTFGQGVEADRREFFPEWSAARVQELYERTFAEEIDAVQLLPGALEVLETLRARGLRQAGVTNTPLALARLVLARKGIAPHLDAIATSGEGAEKPAPDLLLLALRRLQLQGDEALYVGDTVVDRQAARAAGVAMAGIGVAADLQLAGVRDLLSYCGSAR